MLKTPNKSNNTVGIKSGVPVLNNDISNEMSIIEDVRK